MSAAREATRTSLLAGAFVLTVCSCSGPVNSDASAGISAVAPPVVSAAQTEVIPARSEPATSAGSKSIALPEFTPPPDSAIPDDKFGEMVRRGRDIFTDTQKYAKPYVSDGLTCANCHLDAGRRANSAPMWAAYVRYPRYRAKNGKVNSFAERLQGCFRFSMNGKAPPADSNVIKALTVYSYWLATGAPTGKNLAGYGYPKQGFKPSEAPDYKRGAVVYGSQCALCHGADGKGQKVGDEFVFPPLWGPESFNWGAGMGSVNNAAAFIKANMPFSRGGTLNSQDSWDVAYFMDAHERPQDPRFKGDVAATRKAYHDSKWSLYGTEVNLHLLGSNKTHAEP